MMNRIFLRETFFALFSIAILFCESTSALEIEEAPDVSSEFRTPKEQRDLELTQIAPGLKAGFQLEAVSFRERRGSEKASDARLEEAQVEFEAEIGDMLVASLALAYDLAEVRDLVIEESYVRIGGNDETPWFAEVGRMEMPFGEYNSYFSEEASVETIGVMLDEGLILGYEKKGVEFLIATHEGGFSGDDFIASAIYEASEALQAGMYWSSDIRESEELRELLFEALEEHGAGELAVSEIPAAGAFLSLELDDWLLEFEYIAALDSFGGGWLDDDPRRPRAWDFEVGTFLSDHWLLAGRYEASRELPDSPRRQYGLSTTLGVGNHISITLGYLRGEYEDEDPDRNLFTLELIYEL